MGIYNFYRRHGAFKGKTPYEIFMYQSHIIQLWQNFLVKIRVYPQKKVISSKKY